MGDSGGGEGLCSLFRTGHGGSSSFTALSVVFLASARLASFDSGGQEQRLALLQQVDEEVHNLEDAMHLVGDLVESTHAHIILLVWSTAIQWQGLWYSVSEQRAVQVSIVGFCKLQQLEI